MGSAFGCLAAAVCGPFGFDVTSPTAYALIGVAAMLAANCQVPALLLPPPASLPFPPQPPFRAPLHLLSGLTFPRLVGNHGSKSEDSVQFLFPDCLSHIFFSLSPFLFAPLLPGWLMPHRERAPCPSFVSLTHCKAIRLPRHCCPTLLSFRCPPAWWCATTGQQAICIGSNSVSGSPIATSTRGTRATENKCDEYSFRADLCCLYFVRSQIPMRSNRSRC